ncbi:uncharacterized protein LOC124913167 [Impatiens glandulifera]|uniref:uncharacterized protein LOC124913167 n=1 Tax=Impatiens glandulifera TaxID=253017 RepID=UPI001FB12165|nr:uncharacterized protein LOC124913167 [Impatiens glandulifera]
METVVNSSLHPESVDELAVSLIHKAQIFDGELMEKKIDEFELGLLSGDDEDEDEDDEEEFSFVSVGSGSSTFSSDDTFFPLFDQSLLYNIDRNDLPYRPSVKKVFIETEDSVPPSSSDKISIKESRKAVEASPQICKKSNSTGFCKLWRVQELIKRSNSDGRDAYVFFNGPSSKKDVKTEQVKTLVKVKKSSTKGKSEAIKAHEKYMRSREENRRKTYLPYRPELMGFFTNIHGGMTRNVHPF